MTIALTIHLPSVFLGMILGAVAIIFIAVVYASRRGAASEPARPLGTHPPCTHPVEPAADNIARIQRELNRRSPNFG